MVQRTRKLPTGKSPDTDARRSSQTNNKETTQLCHKK